MARVTIVDHTVPPEARTNVGFVSKQMEDLGFAGLRVGQMAHFDSALLGELGVDVPKVWRFKAKLYAYAKDRKWVITIRKMADGFGVWRLR